MIDKEGASQPSRVSAKGRARIQDESIIGTNNSSIVSKRSVERLYFPSEPHFFRYFVKKPQRRAPLINRGYWLRMKAIDHVVRQFLEQSTDKPKIVMNLGCGYDPLPWQCLTRYIDVCKNVTFVDIDYKDLMLKKREIVQRTKELSSMLSNVKVIEEGDLLLRSDQYIQLGCDLRDLARLIRALNQVVDMENCSVLFTAEVSITYMNVEAADTLIEWAATLVDARFCLLEQLLPEGIDHPFAQTMMAHFDKLQTPLNAVQKYPTTLAQEQRFKMQGWPDVFVRSLWELWSAPDFLTSLERRELDSVEPFDEWEEFALFGCHYFLLVADNMTISAGSGVCSEKPDQSCNVPDPSMGLESSLQSHIVFSEYLKPHGYRRFAAPLSVRSTNRGEDRIGNFAGMGSSTRTSSYDVYTNGRLGDLPFHSHGPQVGPSSRMCHTITDLAEVGALLVGGRTSPDKGLSDCWLYHKWTNNWERIDDLPEPRYRHSAVHLGNGYVLISTGRSDSLTVLNDYLLWSRGLGWVKCARDAGRKPGPTYGATFAVFDTMTIEKSTRGLIAGGISRDGLVQKDIWIWELRNLLSKKPSITFIPYSEIYNARPSHLTLARFGAAVVNHHHQVYIIGGVIKDTMLKESNEIVIFNIEETATRAVSSLIFNRPTMRPLWIGLSAMSARDSLLVMGGSAVCFSFGTFWNKGCYTLYVEPPAGTNKRSELAVETWKLLHTVEPAALMKAPNGPTALIPGSQNMVSVPRMKISSPAVFHQILEAAKPIVIEGLDIGPCTSIWTTSYLKQNIGAERRVIVHEASSEHMDFRSKNFAYVTKAFGQFMDQVDSGMRLYLRSLSTAKPSELPADFASDFPSVAKDFRLPPELAFVSENAHSSPLRISGPVIMWLHYDVMANVLSQIRGSKRLLLFPPSDVQYFDFEPGASSCTLNVFDKLQDPSLAQTHPHEALLKPGDVLFIPSLWLHTASPTSGVSIAMNVFFRNLSTGYSAGKDVYGNRDLQAYEKGRQDISKIVKSFAGLPADVRQFYLHRLADEFRRSAHLTP